MRLWIMSDLHLDVNAAYPFGLPSARPAHDAVILAGDLCEGIDRGVDWIEGVGLHERPVVYVPGNHEFYGRERRAALASGRAAAALRRNIYVLDRQRFDLGAVTILGATLWTDYRLYGTQDESMRIAERYLSDHRMISEGDDAKGFSAAHARAEHDLSVAWLAREIAIGRDAGRTLVVVTHHAPTPKSVSQRFKGHPLTAAFASDLEHLFEGVSLWVHGHTHRHCDHTVAATRIINNPRGYLRHETTGFVADLVVEV
jgi:predicted phosphodiesterase